MKTETITRTVLYADEGMVLTNGETYGTQIFLAEGESAESYREITKEEHFNSLPEEEQIAIREHEERLAKEAEEKAMLEAMENTEEL